MRFKDARLDRLETDASYDAGFPQAIVKAFRSRVGFIRAATDERAFRGMRSWNFERLRGDRKHQHSMRLNDQWRLIVEIEGEGRGKVVVVVSIEDYH